MSHHVDAELPVLIAYAEGDAVSDIRGRVAYQGTVGSGDFTVTVHILEFQVARSHGGQGILGRPGYFFVRLVYALYLVTVEVTDGIAGHCVTLALVACDNRVTLLYKAQYLVLDGSEVEACAIAPVANPVAPVDGEFHAFVLYGTEVTDARHRAGDARNFRQQVFGGFLVIYTLEVQAVAEEVGFCTRFPGFHLFPAETGIGQVGQLVARIDGGRLAEYGGIGIGEQRFGRIGLVQILIAERTPRAFQLQHIQPGDVFHELLFGHQPACADGVEILPLVSGVGECGGTVAAERTVEQVSAFVVIEHTSQHGYGTALPLLALVGGCCRIADADVPLVGIVGDNQAYALRTFSAQHLQLVVIGGEAGGGGQAVVAPGIGVGQQVVALYFGFGFLGLFHAGLTVAEGHDVAFHAAVEYVDNRRVGAAAVGSIVHGVHYFELEVFQEVPLTVYIARCAVVFRTGGIGFQVHIHHRVVHLRFLEAGQGGVQAVFGIVYGGYRGCAESCCHTFCIGGQYACAVELEAYFEVIRNFIVVAYVQCDLAVLLVLDIALFVGITGAEVEAVPGGSARNADIVVGDKSGLEDFILPVGIARPRGEIKFGIAFISQLFVVEFLEPGGVDHCNLVRYTLEAERAVDIDARLSFFGFLGGDDDDTVGAAHAEDGEGRRVFQDFHGLDVLRIEEVDVVIEQAVYYIQRFVAVNGVCTAHTYFRICSCLARIDNLYAGYLSLQGGYRVDYGFVGNLIAFYVGDRPGEVAFLGAAVPDDDRFGKHL